MSYKISLIAVLVLLMGAGFAQGQTRSEATDTGAMLVTGMFSFSSIGGDLYENGDGDRYTSIAVAPGLFYFVTPGIGIGGDIFYSRTSQGDYDDTYWGAGPKVGYFMDSGGTAIPFVEGGANFISDTEDNGLSFKFGGGVLIRKDHMAVSLEAAYIIDRIKFEGADKAITGNTIEVSIGFGGFLY